MIARSTEPTYYRCLKANLFSIGMNQHVAFEGGWGNVGNAAAKRVTLKPTDTLALELRLNVAKHTASVVVNGTTLTFA